MGISMGPLVFALLLLAPPGIHGFSFPHRKLQNFGTPTYPTACTSIATAYGGGAYVSTIYECSVCNKGAKPLEQIPLVFMNWNPLEYSNINSEGVINTILDPGNCVTFRYRQAGSGGASPFYVSADVKIAVSVTEVDTGGAAALLVGKELYKGGPQCKMTFPLCKPLENGQYRKNNIQYTTWTCSMENVGDGAASYVSLPCTFPAEGVDKLVLIEYDGAGMCSINPSRFNKFYIAPKEAWLFQYAVPSGTTLWKGPTCITAPEEPEVMS